MTHYDRLCQIWPIDYDRLNPIMTDYAQQWLVHFIRLSGAKAPWPKQPTYPLYIIVFLEFQAKESQIVSKVMVFRAKAPWPKKPTNLLYIIVFLEFQAKESKIVSQVMVFKVEYLGEFRGAVYWDA